MLSNAKTRAFIVFTIWTTIFLIAVFIVKVCLGRFWASKDIDMSQQWYPDYSVTLLKQGSQYLTNKQSDLAIKNAKLALIQAPLSDLAFVQIGTAQALQKNSNEDMAYFMTALRRNNRNRTALRVLFNANVIENNFDKAIEKLDILMRLSGGEKDQYQDALKVISATPKGRAKVNALLKNRASWGKEFIIYQIGIMDAQNQNEIANSLKSFSAGPTMLAEDKFIHEGYMRQLINLNQYDKAYNHWNELNNEADFTDEWKPGTLFNENFENFDSPAPFNWMQRKQEKFYSELTDVGLIAVYNDSKPQMLTNQVIKLEPGREYFLDVDADWSYRDGQGIFTWSLNCLKNRKNITQLKLIGKPLGNEIEKQKFQIPYENCDWQRISLLAKPGRNPQYIRAKMNSLSISPVF